MCAARSGGELRILIITEDASPVNLTQARGGGGGYRDKRRWHGTILRPLLVSPITCVND